MIRPIIRRTLFFARLFLLPHIRLFFVAVITGLIVAGSSGQIRIPGGVLYRGERRGAAGGISSCAVAVRVAAGAARHGTAYGVCRITADFPVEGRGNVG